jgi:hypothetical protein
MRGWMTATMTGWPGDHAVEDERHGAGEELTLALPKEGLVPVSVVGPDCPAGPRAVLARCGGGALPGAGAAVALDAIAWPPLSDSVHPMLPAGSLGRSATRDDIAQD